MATPTPSKVIQIVDHVKGKRTEFYEQDLSKFVAENCIQKNVHYPVFSIIGARSSGKSTLMNLMFNTKFAALNQSRGMNAASRGIWAATCNSPRAIVLDVEGSDGAEHKDDTSFEKKTALFALVISDLMFFNIKQDEIDRNNGGSIPLLRIVLQERLNHRMHKLKIVFVVRDYNDKISKEKLHAKLISMLAKIWGEKFPKNKSSNISDYFEITVEFLPNLDYYGKEEFRNRCAEMRNRNVNHFVAQHYTCPVEEFPRHANILWESIKKNIRLDMPSYWAITSSNRCKAVSDELLLVVKQVISQGYKKLPQHSKDDLNKMTEWLGDILKSSLTAYDDVVKCYHKETAMAFKEELKSQILLNAKPCFKQALDNYEITFGKNMADELECMIEACSNLNDHVILHPILDYIDEFKENITDSVLRSGMYQMGLTVKEWLDESGTGSSSFFPNLTNQVDFLERVKSPVQSKAMEAHENSRGGGEDKEVEGEEDDARVRDGDEEKNGDGDRDWDRYGDGNGYEDGDKDIDENRERDFNGDRDGDGDEDKDGDRYGYGDSDRDKDEGKDVDWDKNVYGDENGDGDKDGDRNRDGDADGDGYGDEDRDEDGDKVRDADGDRYGDGDRDEDDDRDIDGDKDMDGDRDEERDGNGEKDGEGDKYTDRDEDAYGDGDRNKDEDEDKDRDTDGDGDGDRDGDGDKDGDMDGDGTRNEDKDEDVEGDGDGEGDRNEDRNGDGDGNEDEDREGDIDGDRDGDED